MANEVTSSVSQLDQEKYLHAQLIKRSHLKLVCSSICDKVKQKKGSGLTAHFIRYERMDVPVAPLTEGVTPDNHGIELSTVTVTLDQWGDYIILTDVAELTTSHPLFQQAQELLSDNAARVIDREVQLVWLAGTNVAYGGNATARSDIDSSDKISDTLLQEVRVTMQNNGARPKSGPSLEKANASSGNMYGGQAYVAVISPELEADVISQGTANGGFLTVAQYSNAKALYNFELGQWMGFRFVVSNFMPRFTLLATPTKASSAASGGSLANATTYYFKVTRKDLQRGFEEAITAEFTEATGASDEAIAITLPSTAGYVYNVYVGDETGDANLFLYEENVAAGEVVTVLSVPTSGDHPPVAPASGVTVHPVYIHGAESCNWVGLKDLETHMSKVGASTDDPLAQRRTVGYKFLAKAMVTDQTRLLRIECASAF